MKSGPSDWPGFFVRETMESMRVARVVRGSLHPAFRFIGFRRDKSAQFN
jgi:hypothetical protein